MINQLAPSSKLRAMGRRADSSSSMHGPLVVGREVAPRHTKDLNDEHVIVESMVEHVLASALNRCEEKSRAPFSRGVLGQARSRGIISPSP
jgi:hypothetical protein